MALPANQPNPLDPDFVDDDSIRLAKNAFIYTFNHATISTTGASGIEFNNIVDPISKY